MKKFSTLLAVAGISYIAQGQSFGAVNDQFECDQDTMNSTMSYSSVGVSFARDMGPNQGCYTNNGCGA